MLKDITLGQFFPGNSAVHRLDPRVKIVLTVAFIVLLFLAQGPVSYALIIAFLAVVIGTIVAGLILGFWRKDSHEK